MMPESESQMKIEVHALPLKQVFPNPEQPRKKFIPATIEGLAASIRKHGLIQPITVTPRGTDDRGKPRYMIIVGERRWRAHVVAGMNTIDAFVVSKTDAEVDALALVENDHREDVNALEVAEAYARAMREHDWSVKQLVEEIRRPRKKVLELLSLLKVADELKPLLQSGELTVAQGVELARLARARQLFAVNVLQAQRLNAHEFAGLCARLRTSQKQGTLFDLDAFVNEVANAREMGKAERTRKEIIASLSADELLAAMARRGLTEGGEMEGKMDGERREEGALEYRVPMKFRVMHERRNE